MGAREMYPDYEEPFYGPGSYQPILDSFGKIVVQVDDDDYQGDSRVVYKDGDSYGMLVFGWGSCSGCDALQACTTFSDIDELIDQLKNDIKWFSSLGELKQYATGDDRELSHYYHQKEWSDFVNQVSNLK